MRMMTKAALAMAAGALLSWLFDPQNGRRRRAVTRDRVASGFRRAARTAERKGRYYAGKKEGVKHALTPGREDGSPNDATLQHKIESEAFRDFSSGAVNVNVEEGVAVLRGMLERPDQINALIERVRKVDGVVDVRSLLHVRGTPAPTWQSSTGRR